MVSERFGSCVVVDVSKIIQKFAKINETKKNVFRKLVLLFAQDIINSITAHHSSSSLSFSGV